MLSSSASYTVAVSRIRNPVSGILSLSTTAVCTLPSGLVSKSTNLASYSLASSLICTTPEALTATLTTLVMALPSVPFTFAVISVCPAEIAWIVPSFSTVATDFFVVLKVILELGIALWSAFASVRNILVYCPAFRFTRITSPAVFVTTSPLDISTLTSPSNPSMRSFPAVFSNSAVRYAPPMGISK